MNNEKILRVCSIHLELRFFLLFMLIFFFKLNAMVTVSVTYCCVFVIAGSADMLCSPVYILLLGSGDGQSTTSATVDTTTLRISSNQSKVFYLNNCYQLENTVAPAIYHYQPTRSSLNFSFSQQIC